MTESDMRDELEKIEKAIAGQEALRGILPADQLDAALAALREKQQAILAQIGGSAVGGNVTIGEGSAFVGRDQTIAGDNVHGDKATVIVKDGGAIVIGEQPVVMTAVDRESALGRYLNYVISRNCYLQLQGIRSGGKLVNIELEHIYITLRAARTRTAQAEEDWLAEEGRLAPGETVGAGLKPALQHTETVSVKIQEALGEHLRLVVLGDPGSGKTTLLRYLALQYARDRAEGRAVVRDNLGLPESGHLPILLPLRNLGAYLQSHYPRDDGVEGYGRLVEFLRDYLRGERIAVPDNFFDADLAAGRVVLLFDGMDEVANADLRRRVARLIEDFAAEYARCRIVVTSRIVGYSGSARLQGDFATTTVRDFTLADIELFLTHWHRLVAIGQMGAGEAAENYAAQQTRQLMTATKSNVRVRELAINPLMLTVIALVHRDRVKLPDRRAELYAEAVDVLLGKWDEARGVEEVRILDDRPFDAGDRRLLLQTIAFQLHEAHKKEIDAAELRQQLKQSFAGMVSRSSDLVRVVERFLNVIQERTGLLVEAGQGVYRFSHLTFQEYLAAIELAEQDNYVDLVLARLADPWWRETILLAAGYLSTKHRAKTTKLIQTIAECPTEPELFHNLVLAAECLRDVGANRVEGNWAEALRRKLQGELERPWPQVTRGVGGLVDKLTGTADRRRVTIAHRLAAANALSRIESGSFGVGGQYWTMPHGEPKWVTVPAGEFWMGTLAENIPALLQQFGGEREWYKSEVPQHKVLVDVFQIAMTPVTNGQYWIYTAATGAPPPKHWEGDLPPKGKENHPVVYVTWHDAMAYCQWLSQVTSKIIRLPAEAEWEKAARGGIPLLPGEGWGGEVREYPWGNEFDPARCNTSEEKLWGTSPVGIYPTGASLYGCLDMAGNVWEWTQSWYKPYPYVADDGRNTLGIRDEYRVLRGGSWFGNQVLARCAFRNRLTPGDSLYNIGFRVMLSLA